MKKLLTLFCVVSLFFGCEKQSEKSTAKSAPRNGLLSFYDTLDKSAEVVRVNGKVLTKAELESEVNYQVELGKLRNPKRSAKEWAAVRQQLLGNSLERFICRELYLKEAAKAELKTPNAEDVIAVSNNLIVLSGQAKLDLPGVRKLLTPESAQLLDEHLKTDALVQTYLRVKAGKELVITDKDYAGYCEYIKRMQAWSKAEFDKAMKLGNELIERFHTGEDFGKLADEYSLARQKAGYDGPGGVWGEFMPGTLLDEEVREAVRKTPVGECTRPIETPEGLYIVLVEDRKGSGDNSTVNLNPETLKMRRIVLRLPMNYQAMNRKQYDVQVVAQRFKAMQERLLKRLRASAEISYPSGSNLWARVGK